MRAKPTSTDQPASPKAAAEVGGLPANSQLTAGARDPVPTSVRLQRANAVRTKLAQLKLGNNDLVASVAWARAAQTMDDDDQALQLD